MIKTILIIILILILLFLIICFIDCHRLVVRTYEIKSHKISAPARFVMLTDLHGTSFGHDNDILMKKLEALSFDAVLIAGDMFTAIKKNNGMNTALSLVKRLAEKYPVYYANGNHEMKTRDRREEFGPLYEKFRDELRNCGVHYLCNQSETMDADTMVYGLDLSYDYYRKNKRLHIPEELMKQMLGENKEDKFNILLAHNPEYFEEYANWGADLVLSGHYHGGLVRLPFLGGVISPKFQLFPKIDSGKFVLESTTMILSCGLGTHTLPIRVFNPGEISYIIVNKE